LKTATDRDAQDPLRILVVQETDWIERYPILHHRMLEALSLRGDDVTVLDYEILWGRAGRRPIWQGRRVWKNVAKIMPGARVTVIRPAMLRIRGVARFTWLLTSWLELRRYLRSGTPDVIVAYGISNSALARIMTRRRQIPFVFHLFDSLYALAEPALLRPLAALVEGAVLRSADRVVIPYRALRGYLASRGVRSDRVVLIPNGMTRREVDPVLRADVRRRLGIADDEVALLFMGWLYRHSGVAQIAMDLGRNEPRHAKFKLLIVGAGDLAPELERIKRTMGLGDRLILTGRRPFEEMPGFIAASDVCLLPSTPDAAMRFVVPTKVDEYLESGRPVVSSRLEGMMAEFQDMPGIIWVDRPTDVLPDLDRLLSEPPSSGNELAARAAASKRYAASRDDWETIIRRFRAVLTEATAP
jgi:glycosyltransferase involved in cell wall biosynthesis